MKGLFVLRILIIASMLALPLVAVTPAFADTPVHGSAPIDDTEIWLATAEDNPCGFDIVIHVYGTFRFNSWLDENGQTTREIDIYGNLKQTYSAHGKSVNVQMQGPIHYEAISENHIILTWLGTNPIITVPGYGKVVGGAGQIVEEIILDPDTGEVISDVFLKLVGSFNYDDSSAVCEYLSP